MVLSKNTKSEASALDDEIENAIAVQKDTEPVLSGEAVKNSWGLEGKEGRKVIDFLFED